MSKEENTPYSFKGDNAKLVDSIKSLLALDSKGALVPNGVCGLARQLLESAVERLTVAEKRNEAIVGKQTKCKECGSDALFWFDANTNTSGIAEGRLRTNEVTCTFVLGCADCSATLKTVRADSIAERMNEAMAKPTESGASE